MGGGGVELLSEGRKNLPADALPGSTFPPQRASLFPWCHQESRSPASFDFIVPPSPYAQKPKLLSGMVATRGLKRRRGEQCMVCFEPSSETAVSHPCEECHAICCTNCYVKAFVKGNEPCPCCGPIFETRCQCGVRKRKHARALLSEIKHDKKALEVLAAGIIEIAVSRGDRLRYGMEWASEL